MAVEMETNVGRSERWISTLSGAALAAYGVSRLTENRVAGAAAAAAGGTLVFRGTTGHCPMYGTLGVNTAERARKKLAARAGAEADVSVLEDAVTINRPASELFQAWRNVERLPSIVPGLESVEQLDARRSRWKLRGPMGLKTRWEAELVEQVPDHLIRWRAGDGSAVRDGEVRFVSAGPDRGTEVHVRLRYHIPGGRLGSAVAWMVGRNPSKVLRDALRRFKQITETGEVPTTGHQPRGEQKITNYE